MFYSIGNLQFFIARFSQFTWNIIRNFDDFICRGTIGMRQIWQFELNDNAGQ